MKPSHTKSLLRAVRSIPDPINYFAGVSAGNFTLPSQVVLFCRHPDKLAHPPKSHPSRHILIVNLAGTGCVAINNLPMRLPPGYALLIMPRNFHHYTQLQQRPGLTWLFASFELADAHLLMKIKNTPIRMSATSRLYAAKLTAAYLRPERLAPAMATQIATLLWLLLMSLVDSHAAAQGGMAQIKPRYALQTEYQLIERIESYIAEHIEEPIHVRNIAAHVHLSASRVATVFRKIQGHSLGHTIRNLRIYHACQLMQAANVSLSQIADRLGFDNIYAFSRSFKTVTGLAPSAYREKMARSQTCAPVRDWLKQHPRPRLASP